MFPHSNVHTHTNFCDGRDSAEKMVERALALGFVSLGLSIHAYTPYQTDCPSPECEADFRREAARLRALYAGRLEILCGVESDLLHERGYEGYDYRIDSAHYLLRGGEYLCVDDTAEIAARNVREHFGGDWYAYVRAFFEQEAELCAHSTADIIGHIDLVSKFNEGGVFYDPCDPRALSPALEAARCAAERGIPVEMNTGAISRGVRTTPYPQPEILSFLQKHGGEIIINGDSHSADALDTGFDLCVGLARRAGFDHVLRLRQGGMEEVGI